MMIMMMIMMMLRLIAIIKMVMMTAITRAPANTRALFSKRRSQRAEELQVVKVN